MADNSAEIARIQTLLNSGAESVTVDGQTVRISETQLRRRLRELQATDDANPVARPRLSTHDISSAF